MFAGGGALKSGKHPEKALSAAFVRTVCKPGKYTDGNGLFLKVDQTGARRWIQRIVIRGKRTEMGLGSANLVSLAEARELALQNRKLARQGGDPLKAKREAEAVMTFEEAARAVYEIHRPGWRNAKHAAQFIATLETYAFPRLGVKKVTEVGSADVLSVLQPIWLSKPETARRVRQLIGAVMKWAVAKGWRQDNPAEAISSALPKQTERPQHRKSLPYSEVPEFLRKLDNSAASVSAKLALRLIILTATRSGEVRMVRWPEVDLETATWIIPAARMKAKREFRIPLSQAALDLLSAAEKLADKSGFIFPGTKAGKPLSVATLSKLTKELGFDVHVHGLRTSFKTWAQECTNVPREVSEAALAHTVRNKAEAAYARSDLFDKRRELMERWSQSIV